MQELQVLDSFPFEFTTILKDPIMTKSNLSLIAGLTAMMALTSCATVDAERDLMHGSLTASQRLGSEISSWRRALPLEIPESVVQSIESFQSRASDTASTLSGLSTEAKAGVDLAGVQQALEQIVKFDTSRIGGASASARASLLDQLNGLAENLRAAAGKAQVRA